MSAFQREIRMKTVPASEKMSGALDIIGRQCSALHLEPNFQVGTCVSGSDA